MIVAAAGAWISDRKYFGKPGVSSRTKAIITLGQFQYTANHRNALKRQAEWQHALRQSLKRLISLLCRLYRSCRQGFHSSGVRLF
jgi:hypothetical protein